MSEMVERVAAALEPLIRQSHPIDDWDAMALARAAIEAMREPTKHMAAEAADENATTDLGSDDFAGHYGEVWKTMIDAALK